MLLLSFDFLISSVLSRFSFKIHVTKGLTSTFHVSFNASGGINIFAKWRWSNKQNGLSTEWVQEQKNRKMLTYISLYGVLI